MKYFCLLICLILSSAKASAQAQSDSLAVQQTVQQLFDAMRASDSSAVRQVFHPDAQLHSTGFNKEGQPTCTRADLERFIGSIGNFPAGTLDEQILSWDIRVDDNLASVWTPYRFVAGGQLSHCGTNAFQLVKDAERGWLILQITDTRRKEGCE